MSGKEYKAGMRLEIAALNMRKETGANAFHSLIHAALRQADAKNFTILARMFPKTHQELMLLRDSAPYNNTEEIPKVIEAAILLVKLRNLLGVGLQLYEISTEISTMTGTDTDQVHYVLSQNYNTILQRANEV